MSREAMKDEALEALVHTETKQSIAKMLASWMAIRHGVEQDEQKIAVLIEYVVRDVSDFSPLLTDVLTGLVAMLDGAEHRICDMEQEIGALLREASAQAVLAGVVHDERDNLRTLMAVGGPEVRGADFDEDLTKRCSKCGWPLKERIEDGCTEGNCSQRGQRDVADAMSKEREAISSGRGPKRDRT